MKSVYSVEIYFYPHTYLGTIDMGYQGEIMPQLVGTYETVAVSEKQAESNVRYRFLCDGGMKGFSKDHFRFLVSKQ